MDFYNQVINERNELDYFLYLIEHLNKAEIEYEKMEKERDFKLKLILIKDFDDINKYFKLFFDKFKSEVNKMALNKLVVDDLEDLASRMDSFINEMNVTFNKVDLPDINIKKST